MVATDDSGELLAQLQGEPDAADLYILNEPARHPPNDSRLIADRGFDQVAVAARDGELGWAAEPAGVIGEEPAHVVAGVSHIFAAPLGRQFGAIFPERHKGNRF